MSTFPLVLGLGLGYYWWWRKPPARPDRRQLVLELRRGDDVLAGPTTVEIEPARPTTLAMDYDGQPLDVVITPAELVQTGAYVYAKDEPFAFILFATFRDASANTINVTADTVLAPATDNVESGLSVLLDGNDKLLVTSL